MIEYKEKRKIVDDLKDSLQKMIMEYTKLTEAGNVYANDRELMIPSSFRYTD